MSFLQMAHSGWRYVVLLLGLICAGYALYGAMTKQPVGRPMMRLASAFAGAFDLQIVMGMLLLFSGRFSSVVIGHFFTMLFAAACAHIVPSVMRRRKPEARSYIPYLVGTLLALGLIALGIMALGKPIVG